MHHWYALHTKPHAERQVSAALDVRGIQTYLPLVAVWRARRRRVEDQPLFPCYTFAWVDFTSVATSALTWLPGMRQVVNCDGIPIPVPDKVIRYIRSQTSPVAGEEPGRFRRGDMVRIIDGPLKDLKAVFEQPLSGYERAQVLVSVLGRLSQCELPVDWLEIA